VSTLWYHPSRYILRGSRREGRRAEGSTVGIPLHPMRSRVATPGTGEAASGLPEVQVALLGSAPPIRGSVPLGSLHPPPGYAPPVRRVRRPRLPCLFPLVRASARNPSASSVVFSNVIRTSGTGDPLSGECPREESNLTLLGRSGLRNRASIPSSPRALAGGGGGGGGIFTHNNPIQNRVLWTLSYAPTTSSGRRSGGLVATPLGRFRSSEGRGSLGR
jgi:hypothetical protein